MVLTQRITPKPLVLDIQDNSKYFEPRNEFPILALYVTMLQLGKYMLRKRDASPAV